MLVKGDTVRALYAYMTKKRNTRRVGQPPALLIKLIQAMGISAVNDHLNRYAMTIPDFFESQRSIIYTPYIPGRATNRWKLIDQIATGGHEFQHDTQIGRDRTGGWRWALRYANPTQRARIESEAYTTSMELYYYLTGRMPDPEKMASKLKAYKCNSKQIATVAKQLKLKARVIKRGGLITRSAKDVIAFLEKEN